MRKFCRICLGIWFCGLLAGIGRAETFQLTDGATLTGEIVSFNESGLIVRQADDKYSDRVSWMKFSQDDLTKLAQNPKITPFVEPFIEVSAEEKIKKTEVEIRAPQGLKRPEARSLLGAMFSSSVGLFVLFFVYLANLYAAFEVAVYRARPVVLVCGVSALIPVIGPVIFFSMPAPAHRAEEREDEPSEPVKTTPAFAVPGTPAAPRAPSSATSSVPKPTSATAAPVAGQSNLRLSQAEGAGATAPIPQTQVFQRGAFTFNRRFFETKFPGFFGLVRRDADKDMVLVVKSARGEYIVHRISRITTNDFHLQVQKGSASEEIMIPFSEIKEINLKHIDA